MKNKLKLVTALSICLMLLSVVACDSQYYDAKGNKISKCEGAGNDLEPEKTYRIVIIENCEYVYISRRPWDSNMAIAHKGNCNNPIHKGNQ
jgi:hypothetical protein